VRGEHEPGAGGVRGAHAVDERLDEARMVVVMPDLVDLRRALADLGARRGDVVPVLPARRVTPVRAGDERERAPDTVVAHPAQRVGEHRVPVPVAPVHRQIQMWRQRVEQRAALLVDRRYAAEVPVVLGDLRQPLRRHAAAPRDVCQERQHVVRAFRPAEGEQQERVVRHVASVHYHYARWLISPTR
jgi:hypothetical protein